MSGSNARDLCKRWASNYKDKTGCDFIINYPKDVYLFRRLISQVGRRTAKDLVDFAFSDHPSTDYLRKNGYPLPLFYSNINTFQNIIKNPGSEIPLSELELDIPYWRDTRIEYIWSKIVWGDINALICTVTDDYYWQLLLQKMKLQDGFINDKTQMFYDMWKAKDMVERKGIHRAD